jgi:tetratricopeptide (TPR) repeat protein
VEALSRAALRSAPVVVTAIEGMAGVGKTGLAVHAGHLVARRDPFDRVLFVNLRGLHPDPAQPPVEPAAVLDGFLRLLGMSGQLIPRDLRARTAAYRNRLAGTRTLVVLDNAASADQVRPLLPDVPGCPVVVTSRRRLTGLRSATHLVVDVFAPEEGERFLAEVTPGVPIGPDPDAAARIARRCGHLPLALGLVTAHIRATPGWTLTDHADRLDERHRDRRLDTGVELALDLSYRHLPADRRRVLRLLALHPGQDFDTDAAAALADTDAATVRLCLDDLCADHLLQQSAPGRYSYHDLVRDFAASQAVDEDRPLDRRAAQTRLFDHYLATATAAMDRRFPARVHRHAAGPPAIGVPALDDPATALAWLDTERPTLVAVAAHTAAHGWTAHTTRLSTTLFRYLSCDHPTEALAIHGHARDAARQADDPDAEAHALIGLGGAHTQLGHHPTATEHFQHALLLFRQTGDLVGQARAHANLGVIEGRSGRYRAAAEHCAHALIVARQSGNRTVEVNTLNNLGVAEGHLGHYDAAAEHHQRALTLSRRTGNRDAEASALNHLGVIEARLGRYESASDHLHEALARYRRIGNLDGEAGALHHLGALQNRLGRPAQAVDRYREALAIARRIGNRHAEAWVLNGLGDAARTAGRPGDAAGHYREALAIAVEIGARDTQANAHAGLGHAHRALGDTAQARRHHRQAVALYTELDLPEADDLRGHLTTSGHLATGDDRAS